LPNYRADPDIREVLDGGIKIPTDLDPLEVACLEEFWRRDQILEALWAREPGARAPYPDLEALASAAMVAYEERSKRLPLGWQKLLVLRAGVAGSTQNLDDAKIQEWVYTRVVEENPGWLGDLDADLAHEMPLRWLERDIRADVLAIRAMNARSA
jgi:hypothetical protein